MLTSAWIAAPQEASSWSAAWLSLDEGDNDLPRFLLYLVAALQRLPFAGGRAQLSTDHRTDLLGTEALALLQSPQPPIAETILTTLLNEIAPLADNFLLVLDDYHVVENREIDQALLFLLEHYSPLWLVHVRRQESSTTGIPIPQQPRTELSDELFWQEIMQNKERYRHKIRNV